MNKSKVLSVRLDLATLQSCFDLCEALGAPTNGASGAISRALSVLLLQLREQSKLPTYTNQELEILVKQFIVSKNPTSMASLETLSTVDRRDYRTEDFAPLASTTPVPQSYEEHIELDQAIKDDLEDLLEEQIRAQMLSEEVDLLAKIMIT